MLSADKNSLIRGAKQENRQDFEVPPVLGEFTRLLRIIQEEMVIYRVWPVHLSTSQSGLFFSYHVMAGELLVLLFVDPAASRRWKGRIVHNGEPQTCESSKRCESANLSASLYWTPSSRTSTSE